MALNQQEVQSLIDAATAKVSLDINSIIQADGAEVVKEIAAHRVEIENHRAAHIDTMARINDLITGQNTKNAEVVAEILAHKGEILAQQQLLKIQQDRADRALNETMDLDTRLSTLNEQMNLLGRDAKVAIDKVAADAEVTKADILKEFEFRKVEMTQWFDGFKDQSGPPGFGGGKGRGGGTDKNIDKKEIAVWKKNRRGRQDRIPTLGRGRRHAAETRSRHEVC